MKTNKKNFRLFASIAFLLAAVGALSSKFFRALFELGTVLSQLNLPTFQAISADLLAFPLCVAVGVIGLQAGREKLFFWTAVGTWVYCVPLVWLSVVVTYGAMFPGLEGMFMYFFGYDFPEQATTLGMTAGVGLAAISYFSAQSAEEATQAETGSAGASSTNDLIMPLMSLLGALTFPPLGIILGHISFAQMKRFQITTRYRTLAGIGLFLGYALTALIAFIVIMIATWIANWNSMY